MSRKEEILRRAEQLRKEEESRKAPPERPYTGGGMVSRMPLGCWLWILILAGIAFYLLSRFVGRVH